MKLFVLSIFVCLFVNTSFFAFSNIITLETQNFEPYYVGEVGKDWEFPSDHLPIGMTLGSFHVSLWNTLNKDYLNYIESNTQGLALSSLLSDNVQIESNTTLTIRELKLGAIVMEMIVHQTHPRSLIALQETHADFQDYLKLQLPTTWKIVTPLQQDYSQDLFLYDESIFNFISKDSVLYDQSYSPKSIFTITLEEKATGEYFKFIQSHIPGGPHSKEGIEKFSGEVLRQFNENITTVLMGDMNQLSTTIDEALGLESKVRGLAASPFDYLNLNYATHINTKKMAVIIDHFFVYNKDVELVTRISNPEEISDSIVPVVQLLQTFKKDLQ